MFRLRMLGFQRSFLITYHEPSEEDPCQSKWPQPHYHGIVQMYTNKWHNDRLWMEFVQWVKKYGDFKSEAIVHNRSAFIYMRLPPKVLIYDYLKSDVLKSMWQGVTQDEIDQMLKRKIAERDPNLNMSNIRTLKKFIDQYPDIHSSSDLAVKLFGVEEFEKIFNKNTYDRIFNKAKMISNFEWRQKDLIQKLQFWDDIEVTDQYYSKEESYHLVEKWCCEHGIPFKEFLVKLILVLTQKMAKINCFYLHGESNSGKTWISQSIVTLMRYIGEVQGGSSGYTFMFQNCIQKSLILMNEPYFDNAMIESIKLVLEGSPTFVKIKCKDDDMLYRTPVILNTNAHIWTLTPAAEDAIRNRCFIFENLKAQPWLEDVGQKRLHPAWLLVERSRIENIMKTPQNEINREIATFDIVNFINQFTI